MNEAVFITRVLTNTGGGSKAVGLWAKNLKSFYPKFVVAGMADEFLSIYNLPNNVEAAEFILERHGKWDHQELKNKFKNTSIVISSISTLKEPIGYFGEYDIATKMNIPIIFDCVFGIGSIKNVPLLDFAVTPSIDIMREMPISLIGDKCISCHLPVPITESNQKRNEFRLKYNIPLDAYVVTSPCYDGFPWVAGEVAHKFCYETNSYFLSPIPLEPFHNNFRICGHLKQNEMNDLYDASDIILHTRPETFGYNTQQAMMLNKPVILLWAHHGNNGPAEFIHGKAGYIAGTQQGLLDALHFAFKNKDETLERASKAKNNVIRTCAESLATKRFESLLVRAAINKNKMSNSIMKNYEDTEQWFREQKIANNSWRAARANIEEELKYRSFI